MVAGWRGLGTRPSVPSHGPRQYLLLNTLINVLDGTVPSRSTRSHTNSTPLSNPTQLDFGRAYCDDAAELTACVAPVTTLNRGMRRLNYYDIVRLRVGDSMMCVVPAENSKHIKLANRTRPHALDIVTRSLLANRGHLSAAEKEEYIAEQLASRVIQREGKSYHEFNVEIISYPERAMLGMYDLLKSELTH